MKSSGHFWNHGVYTGDPVVLFHTFLEQRPSVLVQEPPEPLGDTGVLHQESPFHQVPPLALRVSQSCFSDWPFSGNQWSPLGHSTSHWGTNLLFPLGLISLELFYLKFYNPEF